MGKQQVDVINITELRFSGFALAPIGVLPAGVTDGIESADVSEQERVKWRLARGDKAEVLTWCRGPIYREGPNKICVYFA